VPGDSPSPFVTSGIRIGTPALTTRGMKEAEMKTIGDLIARAVDARADNAALTAIKAEVLEMARAFPLYGLPVRPTASHK